jgi:hypothetical protein
MARTETETQRAEAIEKELGVDFSVALDIDYLRQMERQIVAAAKKHPEIRNFEVSNPFLERQLDRLK